MGSPNSQNPPREILDQRSPVSPLLEPSPSTFFNDDDGNVDGVEDDNDHDKEYDEDDNNGTPSPGTNQAHPPFPRSLTPGVGVPCMAFLCNNVIMSQIIILSFCFHITAGQPT